jgi:hypothetical protein
MTGPSRSQLLVALIAAGAALVGSIAGSVTSIWVATERLGAEAELEANSGLRADRLDAYAGIFAAEDRLWQDVVDAYYCESYYWGTEPGLSPELRTLERGPESRHPAPSRYYRFSRHDPRFRDTAVEAFGEFQEAVAGTDLIASFRASGAMKELEETYGQLMVGIEGLDAYAALAREGSVTGEPPPEYEVQLSGLRETMSVDLTQARSRFLNRLRIDLVAGDPEPAGRVSQAQTARTISCRPFGSADR